MSRLFWVFPFKTTLLDQFISCVIFPGKDKRTVQLKVKAFEMHDSSPSYINAMTTDTTNITCSAYGNTQEMTGTITKSGRNIPFAIERREDNLFVVKAEVSEDGTYVCTIEYGKEKVESAPVVEFFTRKFIF